MAIEPDVLVQRLVGSFPALTEPTALQIVEDAIEQFSQDVPIMTSTTLAIRSGTASYDLPADFLFLIELPALVSSDNVLLSDGGIIPLTTAWEERWYIEGDRIRFEPTPVYTLNRTLRYAARHVLADGVYSRLNENGARLVLLYARYLVLQAQAAAAGESGWRYKIGDEEVDKSRLGQALLAQTKDALESYQVAVKQLKGYGGMGRVEVGDWGQV